MCNFFVFKHSKKSFKILNWCFTSAEHRVGCGNGMARGIGNGALEQTILDLNSISAVFND